MKFKSTESLFARIRENLSSYTALGLIDEGKFFFEVKWFINHLGISMYEMDEDILHLKEFRGELPCNFYMLDSAWLCSRNNSTSKVIDNFQGKTVIYTENTCEKVIVPSCSANCQDERVFDRITVKEYVQTEPYSRTYIEPRLLQLGNKITDGVCTKECPNLFVTSESDISIRRRGNSYYLLSNLKEPSIYLRYYAYPTDEETGLPLIPDEPILEKALEDHLMVYFFKNLWLNDDNPNVQQKLGFLTPIAMNSMNEAEYYAKLPTFQQMINTTIRQRNRYRSYEAQDKKHY